MISVLSTLYKVLSTLYKVLSTLYKVLSALYKVLSTLYKVLSTLYKVLSTLYNRSGNVSQITSGNKSNIGKILPYPAIHSNATVDYQIQNLI